MPLPLETPPEVMIRRVRPADSGALRTFYANLSPESRHARFLGLGPGVTESAARSFCTPDHMHDEGFVAVSLARSPADCVIGHLCLEPAARNQVELALAVADAYHGRGIGRQLFEAALEWARTRGIREVVASAFVNNSRVLRLLSSSPYGASMAIAGGGVVDVTIPIEPPLPRAFNAALYQRSRRSPRRSLVHGRGRPVRAIWRDRRQSRDSSQRSKAPVEEVHDARPGGN